MCVRKYFHDEKKAIYGIMRIDLYNLYKISIQYILSIDPVAPCSISYCVASKNCRRHGAEEPAASTCECTSYSSSAMCVRVCVWEGRGGAVRVLAPQFNTQVRAQLLRYLAPTSVRKLHTPTAKEHTTEKVSEKRRGKEIEREHNN